MSRDRDTKSLQDKLKVFFKKGSSAPLSTRNELTVTPELERELGPETPLHRRIRSLKDLGEKALKYRIHEGDVNKLWCCTRDLLEEAGGGAGGAEGRHAALCFLRCVAEGQAEHLSLSRTLLFSYLTRTHAQRPCDDELLRFKLLHTLTNTGKNITSFEELIGPFLVEWLSQMHSPALSVEMLQLIMNVVKFNASYLDEEVVHSIVIVTCQLCEQCPEVAVTTACLDLLEAVLSYSLLPRASLDTFVVTLCRTVNLEHCSRTSWKLMRYVLNADMGAMCVSSLCSLAGSLSEAGALRGCVFYVNMALWGARRTPPHAAPLCVLPRLLQAAESGHSVVVYEVAVGLCAATARPHDLHAPEWHLLLRVLTAIATHHKSVEPRNEKIHQKLHECISSVEQLLETGQFRGEVTQLLELVELCAHERPEASVMRLITLQANSLSPTSGGWIAGALNLCSRYIRCEPRRTVREHALNALRDFIARYRVSYGEEVTERVTLPALAQCAGDADPQVRAAAARLLPALAISAPTHYLPDFIDLLEKILNRPFEMSSSDKSIPAEADMSDVSAATAALLQLVAARALQAPGAHAARCLLVLIEHLDAHYKRAALLHHHPAHRAQILDMMFGLRVNAHNCVGFCYDAAGAPVFGVAEERAPPVCSPFLLVEPCAPRGQGPPPHRDLPQGACLFPAGRVARVVLAALSREQCWPVLARLLAALPALLAQRALCVARRAQELQLCAATLCAAVSERAGVAGVAGVAGAGVGAGGARPLVSELHAACLPALCALAPYHNYLEPTTQQRIVRCLLKYGMVLRQPAVYIHALTICTLEMRDTMVKMLPEVLLELSKITPTTLIAAPMLEFLSTLTRLPRVFASFVEDQYMSVFAILLPYTNPSRYEHYVVSLAHHVIAAWFLKCRLSYRRNFVRFIIHGLHNYIIKPFEEQLHRSPAPQSNEDSSNRQRSSSLGSRVRGAGGGGAGRLGGVGGAGGAGGSQSAAFHVELTETCVDLLARYTFTPCTVKPQRSDTAEFLFTGGQSMTWLVGHKLVTITTSGCLQNSIKQGLCDRCAVLCRQHADSAASPLPPLATPSAAPSAAPPPPPPPPSPLRRSSQSEDSNGGEASSKSLQVQSQTSTHSNPPEIKRYSKSSLQHSRSQVNDPAPPHSPAQHSPHSSRQNSSENSKSTDPLLEALNQFSEHFEKVSKEVDGGEGGTGRVGALHAAGACPCWCGNWAELHVRSPTGDVAWLMRMQNQMNWESVMESPLQDVAALLMPVPPAAPTAPAPSAPAAPPQPAQSNTNDVRPDGMRARSGSANTQRRAAPPPDLHKSSSDSVVERRAPPLVSALAHQPLRTAPINIPGSPQRQSSASTTDDEDLLLIVPEGKSRHPVRRSNSSPEMSSSWKLPPRAPPSPSPAPAPPASPAPPPPALRDMLVLPSCEPTGGACLGLLASKKPSKKSDMRVSCEAIPEEMSGTSPHHPTPHPPHHPHLATYKSDPGSASETEHSTSTDHHQLQKTASDTTVSRGGGATVAAGSSASTAAGHIVEELPPLARSKRSNTISVMSPTRRRRESPLSRSSSGSGSGSGSGPGSSGGVTPAFVFLQLYHNMSTYPTTPRVPGESATHLNPLMERPLRVSGEQHVRTIKTLDLLPPLETYKIGVLYVGPGQQDDEVQILKNEYGSVRYSEFVRQLGTLVSLDEEQPNLFLNLERGGKDGHYTYVWHDDIMQVLFHVATAMPSLPGDPMCNEKRKYIGNDYVSIVYNNSGADFNIHTIKGQFNVCIVVVEPLEHGLHRVVVKSKEAGPPSAPPPPPATVADAHVAVLARQRALHASLASQISASLSRGGAAFASNWLERLRAIKRLRRRCEAERLAAAAPEPYAANELHARVAIDDFNDYT